MYDRDEVDIFRGVVDLCCIPLFFLKGTICVPLTLAFLIACTV